MRINQGYDPKIEGIDDKVAGDSIYAESEGTFLLLKSQGKIGLKALMIYCALETEKSEFTWRKKDQRFNFLDKEPRQAVASQSILPCCFNDGFRLCYSEEDWNRLFVEKSGEERIKIYRDASGVILSILSKDSGIRQIDKNVLNAYIKILVAMSKSFGVDFTKKRITQNSFSTIGQSIADKLEAPEDDQEFLNLRSLYQSLQLVLNLINGETLVSKSEEEKVKSQNDFLKYCYARLNLALKASTINDLGNFRLLGGGCYDGHASSNPSPPEMDQIILCDVLKEELSEEELEKLANQEPHSIAGFGCDIGEFLGNHSDAEIKNNAYIKQRMDMMENVDNQQNERRKRDDQARAAAEAAATGGGQGEDADGGLFAFGGTVADGASPAPAGAFPRANAVGVSVPHHLPSDPHYPVSLPSAIATPSERDERIPLASVVRVISKSTKVQAWNPGELSSKGEEVDVEGIVRSLNESQQEIATTINRIKSENFDKKSHNKKFVEVIEKNSDLSSDSLKKLKPTEPYFGIGAKIEIETYNDSSGSKKTKIKILEISEKSSLYAWWSGLSDQSKKNAVISKIDNVSIDNFFSNHNTDDKDKLVTLVKKFRDLNSSQISFSCGEEGQAGQLDICIRKKLFIVDQKGRKKEKCEMYDVKKHNLPKDVKQSFFSKILPVRCFGSSGR